MAKLLPDIFEFRDWHWMGPNLASVMAVMQVNPSTNLTESVVAHNAVMMYRAAMADAEEMMKKGKYLAASNSYHVAIVATKLTTLLDLPDFLDLVCKYARSLLQQKNWMGAFNAALATTEIKPDFAEGYMLMCHAVKGEGVSNTRAAGWLLKGMEMCNLCNEETVCFIIECSDLVAQAVQMMVMGGHTMSMNLAPGFFSELNIYRPALPQTADVWTCILTEMARLKRWAGAALLTVGLDRGEGGERGTYHVLNQGFCCLDRACPSAVDCSAIHVEEIYESLTLQEVREWGDALALYMLDHRGSVGKKQHSLPQAIHLVKMALTYKTTEVLRWVLQQQMQPKETSSSLSTFSDWVDVDKTDTSGDTALHVVAKISPVTTLVEDIVRLLVLTGGALPNICDRVGRAPLHYISGRSERACSVLNSALKAPVDGFKKRIERLKAEGNQMHRAKQSERAGQFYKAAIRAVEQSPYTMPRDLAVLYNNMAAVEASIGDSNKAFLMAHKSVKVDPTYHKPYWRLGKSLVEKKNFAEACDKFLSGLQCMQVDTEQKAQFVQEVCSMLPFFTDQEVDGILKRLKSHLSECWPRTVEWMTRSAHWELLRRLVLGPPMEKDAEIAFVNAGWKFADCYSEGNHKVGYAMTLKANTAVLNTLVDILEKGQGLDNQGWVTDLVLGLLLQGARPTSLLPLEEATSWYHIVLFLCCSTEKLGLMRYIMSVDEWAREAREAKNSENRTLLHAVSLHFSDGVHQVGRQLVQLLMSKGVNPAATDVLKKRAVDYVAPDSPVYKMLQSAPGNHKTAEEMKEMGNSEYGRRNYREAISHYTQAITLLRSKLPASSVMTKGHEKKKHELAVLYSNRSECHLQLGMAEEAFSDAKECVAFDGLWYRGHIRVARALLAKNKTASAVKAFSNAFNALGSEAKETQKKDVLKELVKTLLTHTDIPPDRIPNLGFVSADLWAKLTYDYFCQGNAEAEKPGPNRKDAEWDAALYCFRLFNKSPINFSNPPNIQLNLKPLCSWQLEQRIVHSIGDIIIVLLQCGSDHTTLSLYHGDTYVHAAALLTVFIGNTTLLDWMMKSKIKPRHEENLQDSMGNTILHLFADPNPTQIPPPPLPPNFRQDMCRILVDWGVNPRVRNMRGQLPLDCVEYNNTALRTALAMATEKAPEPKAVPKQTIPSQAARPADADPKGVKSQASTGGGEAVGGKNSQGVGDQRLQCSQCEEMLADAKNLLEKGKTLIGYSKLVTVLGYKHQKDSRHQRFVNESLDLIVQQLGKSLTPDVPDGLLKMSQNYLHKVLEKLANQDRWRQVMVVVEKARSLDVPRGSFARNMSLLALIKDKGLCGAEAQRIQILNLLVAHGATMGSNSQTRVAMEAALSHGEWRLAQQLIELGLADVRTLTLSPEDTPLHAALALALHKDKGNNFSLLEYLLSLYDRDPTQYAYLDPRSAIDRQGNTLLHDASRAIYSKHSHRAVEMLVAKDVPVDLCNSEGRTAIEYLRPHDRRTQYLKVAGKQSLLPSKQKDNGSKRSEPSASLSSMASASEADPVLSRNKKSQDADRGTEDEYPLTTGVTQVDRQGFKTKTALSMLNDLVGSLSELTLAEARIAKASKANWLKTGSAHSPHRTHSLSDSEEEEERGGGATEGARKGVTMVEVPKAFGDANLGSEVSSTKDSEDEEEDEEEEEGKLEEGEEDLDLSTFDNLDWEVECTAEVWKTLRDPCVTFDLRQRIIRSLRFLANGEWRPQLCRKVRRVPNSLNLYQAKFMKGARILWELAIAFSPRLSEAAEKRIEEDDRKGEFAVRGGRIYTEIIRVWDIIFRYDKMKGAVQKIIQSHQRGEGCLIRTELKGVKSQQFQGQGASKRIPVLYSEADMMTPEMRSALQEEEREGRLQLCPPASASQLEFHILKFYCFSSTLVSIILKNLEMPKIDLPFRVTDREHAVIHLKSRAPILLLGRSGTGKTTCCLYRLWTQFLAYWTSFKEQEGEEVGDGSVRRPQPWLPRNLPFPADIGDSSSGGGSAMASAVFDKDDTRAKEGRPDSKVNDDEDENPHADLFCALLEKENQGTSSRSASGSPPLPAEGATKQEGDGEGEGKEKGEETGAAAVSHVKYSHLHQLFVTKNQVLCSEVQKNFRELCHAHEAAKHHVAVEEAPFPHRLQDMDEYKYPLFLTSRQLILLLDASLPPPHFFERNEDGSLRVIIHGWGADEEIFAFVPLEDDSDEEQEEEYVEDGEQGEDNREGDNPAGADHPTRKKDNRREVTYHVFAHEVWPKITKKMQVSYHPSLVWTEIMSFIKGSFASLAQPKGYLDLESYQQLGRKQAPNFTGSRDKVHELFLRYTDYKRQNGLYDEADLVFHIHQRLKTAGPLPWVLHQVYVDETQDFTQAELTVLIGLADSPNHMFLTGDTAQGIMRGVSFRFSDLKTLFHYARQTMKASGAKIAGPLLEVPKHVYQLTHNYRSHAGILSLASAVLDVLVEFFPESFDRLEKDQGLFDGPPPVLLESGSPADLAILLSGNRRKTSHIEFGAHQVILVVSEEARNSLPEELSLGLVLTIYEAKGLEFDDVLLYNFFTDSEAHKEWRVVTDFLERLCKKEVGTTSSASGLVEIDENLLHQVGRPRPLNFDPNQHKILNSELKHLYTAVTRARVNVWIFDQNAEKRAPMFEYFKARKLVKFVSMAEGSGESGVASSMFAEKSSPEEWERRGDEIMGRSLYGVAAKCYGIAGSYHKRDVALAHQRALAASQLHGQPRQMRDEFLKAAILFLECHHALKPSDNTLALRYSLVTKAGRCLQNARENHLAATVFEKNGQPELAGPLYLRARKYLAASLCFEHIDNFGRALKILDEQELYDQAIDCLQRYIIRKEDFEKKKLPLPKPLKDHKPDGSFTIASLSYKAAKFYHHHKNEEKMLAAIERLPNREEQIKFFQKHGFLQQAAAHMMAEGRIAEATRMMLQNGQADIAIRMAEEGTDSALRAQSYLLKAQHLLDTAASRQARKEARSIKSPTTGDNGQGTTPEGYKSSAGKQTSGKKEAEMKSGKKDDAASSDDDDDNSATSPDDSQKLVVQLLERAYQQFDVCKDYSGMGECQLLLAELRQDIDLLNQAYRCFHTTQPVPNNTGMLDCVETLHKITNTKGDSLEIRSWNQLIWGVERVFDVVKVFLQPSTAEDKNRYQLYLSYYGLEKSGERELVFYPKMRPRFVRMIGKKRAYPNKEERKEERVVRNPGDVVNPLAHCLIQRTQEWCQTVRFYLDLHLPSVLHCATFQEGQPCDDKDYCPYLHNFYTPESTQEALNLLSSQVRLDHALQLGAESLSKIDNELYSLTLSLIQSSEPQQGKKDVENWKSVERLLGFLFPAGPLVTYHMKHVTDFCQNVARCAPTHEGIKYQIERYLNYLWMNPGRVGRGKSENVLKERCKSSAWMVLASLLVPIFNLNIKVDECCKVVEVELDKQRPNWVRKRHKYALLTDQGIIIFLARRHLDALRYLQAMHFDPFEALIKFTKFVKLLFDRHEISLFPDLPVFLHWMEVFTTIALCLALKIRGSGAVFLPECYPRQMRLFLLTLPSAQRSEFWKMMDQFRLHNSHTMKLLHERIEILGLMLYGDNRRSSFSLLSHLLTPPRKKRSNGDSLVLAERCLVLALTLLLNVEQGNVASYCKAPLMQCVSEIHLDDPDVPRPPRLSELVRSVQGSASYRQVLEALSRHLGMLNERGNFYQWRLSKDKGEALMPVNMAGVQTGGPLRLFRQHAWEGEVEGGFGVGGSLAQTPSEMDDIDDVDQQRNQEEEEELDDEEKATYQQQMKEAKEEEKRDKAIKVIIRCFRLIKFRKRLQRLRVYCMQQSEREMFSPFIVTDRMCGICGISFDKATQNNPVQETANTGAEGEEEEGEGMAFVRVKQVHLNSDEHRNKQANFGIFRQMYRQFIISPLMEIGAFLSKMKVKQEKNRWYKDLDYQLDTVLDRMDKLQQMLDQALQDRNWNDREALMTQRNEFAKFFQENVRDPVCKRFERHEEQQKQKTAVKDAEKEHQEKLMEDMVEDPDTPEIFNVVDQPLLGMGPNAQGGRGWHGRSRYFGRGRGASQRGRGSLGHRGHGPPGGPSSLEGQFEKGDLPPRFRKSRQ